MNDTIIFMVGSVVFGVVLASAFIALIAMKSSDEPSA
jgi:hypothetical protein